MHFLSKIMIVLVLTLGIAHAAAQKQKPIMPYPEAEIVEGTVESADHTISKIQVSHDYPTSHPELVEVGVDLIAARAQRMDDFIESRGEFEGVTHHEILVHQYEIGDPRYAEVLIKAKKRGIPVKIAMDLNAHLKPRFHGKQTRTFNFSEAAYDNSPNGRALEQLRAAGFEYLVDNPDAKWGIGSQSLKKTGTDRMQPIDHNKEEVFKGRRNGEDVYFASYGTDNVVAHGRLNMRFIVGEPLIAQYMYEHTLDVLGTFAQGKEIKDIPFRRPRRFVYPKDGSHVEVAYTSSGRQKVNPNSRIAFLFQEIAQNPELYENVLVWLRHFVVTNADVVEALRRLLAAKEDVHVRALLDKKFFSDLGYGMAIILGGDGLLRLHGHPVTAFNTEAQKRTELKIYMRGEDGEEITDPDGKPDGVHLNHDKTTVITMLKKILNKIIEVAYVFTGSLNLSGHYTNSELQIEHMMIGKSLIAAAISESIDMSMDHDIFSIKYRDALASMIVEHMTNHTFREVKIKQAISIRDAFNDGRYEDAIAKMRKIRKTSTTIRKKITEAEFESRIMRLTEFLEWYTKNKRDIPQKGDGISLRRLFFVTGAILHSDLPPSYVRNMVEGAVWTFEQDDAVVDRLTRQAWKILEMDAEFPEKIEQPIEQSVVDCDTLSGGSGARPKKPRKKPKDGRRADLGISLPAVAAA